jgi:hypothetical protein
MDLELELSLVSTRLDALSVTIEKIKQLIEETSCSEIIEELEQLFSVLKAKKAEALQRYNYLYNEMLELSDMLSCVDF